MSSPPINGTENATWSITPGPSRGLHRVEGSNGVGDHFELIVTTHDLGMLSRAVTAYLAMKLREASG